MPVARSERMQNEAKQLKQPNNRNAKAEKVTEGFRGLMGRFCPCGCRLQLRGSGEGRVLELRVKGAKLPRGSYSSQSLEEHTAS